MFFLLKIENLSKFISYVIIHLNTCCIKGDTYKYIFKKDEFMEKTINNINFKFLDDSNDFIVIMDALTQKIVFSNKNFKCLFNIKCEDEIDINTLFSIKDTSKDNFYSIHKQILDNGYYEAEEILVNLPNNNQITYKLNIGFFDDDKKYIYFIINDLANINLLKNYNNLLAEFPMGKLLILLDDKLSILVANDWFNKEFSLNNILFVNAYDNKLINAFDNSNKEYYYNCIKEQLKDKHAFSIDVRIKDSIGIYHSAIINGVEVDYKENLGQKQLYCTITLLDEQIKLNESLKREKQFFEIAQSLSNALIFRLDIKSRSMHYYGSTQGMFKLPEVVYDFPNSLLNNKLLPDNSIPIFKDMANKMYDGVIETFEFEAFTKDNIKQWFLTEYDVLFDSNNIPIEIVGKITNIDRQKMMEHSVKFDPLTNCLTKNAFELLTKEVLLEEDDRKHALFLIDIDNFKSINDVFGHLKGDEVLKEIGYKLQSIFRKDDYVGRIGGDEFMVLLKGNATNELIEKKAKEILKSINNTYLNNGQSVTISASIGISIYPLQGQIFNDLYQKADVALYKSKNYGKDCFFVYDEVLQKGTMENKNLLEIANRSVAQHFDKNTVMDIFDILYSNIDLENAVIKSLEILEKRFAINRCFILQKDDMFDSFYFSEIWPLEKRNELYKQTVSKDIIDSLDLESTKEDMIYCNDFTNLDIKLKSMLEDDGVKSFIYFIIRNKQTSHIDYIIGFDDLNEQKIWSPIEISTLNYSTKIIGQFCSYSKVVSKLVRTSKEQLSALDNLNFYAYMVGEDDYKLRYFNKITENTVKGIKVGDYCYNVIRGYDKPCDDCPIKHMKKKNINRSKLIMNNNKYNMTILVNASRFMAEDGNNNIFVASTDVTNIIEK